MGGKQMIFFFLISSNCDERNCQNNSIREDQSTFRNFTFCLLCLKNTLMGFSGGVIACVRFSASGEALAVKELLRT